MELDFNLISLLDSAGVLQGVVLGLLLIILNKRKYKSTIFLGVFLILYAIQRIPDILTELNIFEYYPELLLLPLISLWILYPIFFLYTQQVAILSNEKIKYWLLYPGIVFFIFQVYVYFLPYETKLSWLSETWFMLLYASGIFLGWIIAIWNIKYISQHKIEVNNQFSMTQFKELRWARIFLIVSIIGSVIYIFQYYLVPKNIYSRVFFLIFDLLIIYWVSYHGVVQRNVLSILSRAMPTNSSKEKIVDGQDASELAKKDLEILMKRIDDYMLTSESFIHTELTIMDLAEKLKVHPKRISTAINSIRNQNFNSYVNQFRIKKAEKLLENKELENLSIEGIGHEVGFHSKSAFYAAFKKVTGTTPTKYKEKHAA